MVRCAHMLNGAPQFAFSLGKRAFLVHFDDNIIRADAGAVGTVYIMLG